MHYVLFLTILIGVLFCPQDGYSKDLVWEPTNGPYGGEIRILLPLNDEVLYAGISGGVYRSENSGDSWTPINPENVR